MFIAFLTLVSALSLAGVVGLFSIAGIMTIYAGAPFHSALIMGVVMECAKLVSLSWLYRNWKSAGILLRGPLIAISLVIMVVTNIGVFGFLSKSHLEQGAATIDNSAKVEQINQQIAQEQSRITDSEKIIAQMDGAVNSLIGKDQASRSLSIRRSQASQRKQLRDEILASQAQISKYNQEKFVLESEVRKLQLEVGPIRYVSEIFHAGSDTKSIENAVQIFTLLIVLILDPAAVMLLLAANHSFAKKYNEKENQLQEKTASINTDQENRTICRDRNSQSKGYDEGLLSTQENIFEPDKSTFNSFIAGPVLPAIAKDLSVVDHTEIPETHKEPLITAEKIPHIGDSFVNDITESNGIEIDSTEGIYEPEQSTSSQISKIPSLEINSEKEKSILENFSQASSGLPVHTSKAPSTIHHPNITRVSGDVGLENKNKFWQWSKFSDTITEKNKAIKTLSWLKEFGKE